MASWMTWICCDIADSWSSLRRLNSSKHPHAPHCSHACEQRGKSASIDEVTNVAYQLGMNGKMFGRSAVFMLFGPHSSRLHLQEGTLRRVTSSGFEASEGSTSTSKDTNERFTRVSEIQPLRENLKLNTGNQLIRAQGFHYRTAVECHKPGPEEAKA